MPPGVSGTLVPSGFIADVLPSAFSHELQHARRTAPLAPLIRWWKRVARELGPASSARRVMDLAALPLLDLLGFELRHSEPRGDAIVGIVGDRQALPSVLIVLPWTQPADRSRRDVHRAARTVGARWALVTTGRSLHLWDATRTWARRSLDFDLDLAMRDERAVVLLWMLARADGPATLEAVVQAADAHAEGVCRSLREGVMSSLTGLLGALHPPRASRGAAGQEAIEQALTVVYRILFLLFAEARGVVPTWHRVYREAYTIDALYRRSVDSQRSTGLWESLQAMARLAHAGCRAGDLQVTAFNGRLFSPRHAPLVAGSRVRDAVIRETILSLTTAPSASGRRRITYADLGVEQLGAVYERILEYEAIREEADGHLRLTRTSTERKSTGSFYTPRAITEFLVRRTLHPLVEGRSADDILALRVVDPAMGSGAFLVAACRFLARAVEQARIASGEWNGNEVTAEQRAAVRRSIAQRCLYGVDLNPTAVQLARLSLWLTTLAIDRPLTFLDHHLAVGDSLVGASLDDIARQPPGGCAQKRPVLAALPLFDMATTTDMATAVLPSRFRLAEEPADTVQAVHDKERTLRQLEAAGTPLARWKAAADLWCAGWFWPDRSLTPRVYADLLSALLQRAPALPARHSSTLLERAALLARAHNVFHWQLAFPEIFFDRDGTRRPNAGFDAVLGNPPWDVLRSDSGSQHSREQHRVEQRQLLRFLRGSGVYRLGSSGHANRYQFFVERALQLLKPAGRLGVLLPSGLATDHGSAPLRRALLDTTQLERIFGFTNREAIFPIHRDVRFLLLTATQGGCSSQVTCRFGLRHAAWLDELPDNACLDPPDARRLVLSRALVEACDPERLTIPELDDVRDLEIIGRAVTSAPRLGDERGWNVRFGRELNATDDRPHFLPRTAAHASWLPVIEGKLIEPFRVAVQRSPLAIAPKTAARLLGRDGPFTQVRLAYRDVASATNRVTLIAALLPAGTVSTHTVFCLKTPLDEPSQYCLLAFLNSLVVNYLVRLQVTTHVSASLMARLPVPVPPRRSRTRRRLIEFARALEASGVESNADAYARLNADVAGAYALDIAQFEHIVATFPLLPIALRERCVAAYAGR